MPRHDAPRIALIRGAALGGVAALVLTGVNVLFLPAAILGVLLGVTGIRHVGDDPEAASLRLGAALIASSIVAIGGLIAGSGVVAAPAGVLAALAFAVSWRACENLRADRRRAWGIRQGLVLQRDRELSDRQRALRDGQLPPSSTEDRESES